MSNKNIFKGILLVGLGATSYGMLATFVKLAYKEHFTTAEVTAAQFVIGIIGLLIVNFISKNVSNKNIVKASPSAIFKLMMAGISLGTTSVFYYLSVKYIPVSIAIVLLMQTVWMGVLLEWILDKKDPSIQKIFSVIIVLIGTFLATNIFDNNLNIDWRGVFWGFMAASSFTVTMFSATRVAIQISSAQRSLYMLLGGTIVVFCFCIVMQITTFNFDIFLKWGILIALFGTIIPPLLMNAGFPHTGIGVGSIVSSLELPVSVTMAYLILDEEIVFSQWMGILLIVFAIVIMNMKIKKD
jgi:drug/metabolite transporter (DMT)-like permease